MQQTSKSVSLTARLESVVHTEKLIWGASMAFALYLVASPIAMLIFGSLRSTKEKLPFEATRFTFENYIRVFTSSATYELFLNSLWFAAGSIILCTFLSVALAWLLERTDIPWRPFLMAIVIAPMGLPGIVNALSWILLANPNNGWINVLLRGLLGVGAPGPLNIYSIPGMIIVTALRATPGMYLLISATFSRLDPSLEEASSMAGVRGWTTFRRITLPLLRPGILAAVIFYFILFIEVFDIPALLGLPKRIFVLSTAVFEAMHPRQGLADYGLASGYAALTVLLASGFIYFYSRAVRGQSRFAVVTGKGYRPRLIKLGAWKYVAVGLILLYFFLAVALPFFILVWASLLRYYQIPSFKAFAQLSLANYTLAFTNKELLRSALNTFWIAVMAATGIIMIATVISWLSIRRPFRGSGFPDRFTFVIFGVPGVVVALALVFIYIPLPWFYGSIWILTLAMITRFLPYITRLTEPALLQVHRELEEASSVSGVSWTKTMRRVVLPLIQPALARGWLWVFVQVLTETGISVMLFVLYNDTISVRLWIAWFEDAMPSYASAIAVLLMLISGGITYFIARWTLLGEKYGKGHTA